MHFGSPAAGVGEKVPGTMLEPLIIRQEQGGPVAQAVLVKDPVQPGLLPGGEAELGKIWPRVHDDPVADNAPGFE